MRRKNNFKCQKENNINIVKVYNQNVSIIDTNNTNSAKNIILNQKNLDDKTNEKNNSKTWYEKVSVWIAIIAGTCAILGVSVFSIIKAINNELEDSKITTESTQNDDEMLSSEQSTESFSPDYEPKKENIYKDSTYKSNKGYFSKQNEMYYFATSAGIYKTNSDFEECELITEDQNAKYLNVIGDWIYYSTEKGIYGVKTDGKEKKMIVELDDYPLDMMVMEHMIYYIKSNDAKLYVNHIDGKMEKCIYDQMVSEFLYTNSHIFLIKAKKNEYENDIILYQGLSIIKIEYDGSEPQTLLSDSMFICGKPLKYSGLSNLCEYDEKYILFKTFNGIYMMDKNTGIINEYVLTDDYGRGLCIFNDYAYYCSFGTFNNEEVTIKKIKLPHSIPKYVSVPFEDNLQLQYIYPVEDKIILTLDCETWYYLDGNNELQRIAFDVK